MHTVLLSPPLECLSLPLECFFTFPLFDPFPPPSSPPPPLPFPIPRRPPKLSNIPPGAQPTPPAHLPDPTSVSLLSSDARRARNDPDRFLAACSTAFACDTVVDWRYRGLGRPAAVAELEL